MLTCSLNEKIISIDVNLNLNSAHTFSISFLSGSSSYALKTELNIYRDGVNILNGIVTSYNYNALSRVMTITGQDLNSYTCSHNAQPNALITLPNTQQTTLENCINSVHIQLDSETQDIINNCPVISCYGYGSYNGDTQSFIDRCCNSFGLNWYSNPTGAGYNLAWGDITEPLNPTVIPGMDISQNSDINTCISNIHVQKAITSGQRQTLHVKNGNIATTQQVRLVNPNSVNATTGNPQFPKDYFIDPWAKAFVTIDVPISTVIYKEAISISPAQKVTYANCNDTLVNPSWKLEIYDGDPGVGDIPSANRLGYISRNQTWEANNSEQYASYLRVARDIQTNGQNITTYPTYDGVTIKCYTWPSLESALNTPWSSSYSSGDTQGRDDLNIISEAMYPSKSSFDSQNLGTHIAGKDSLNVTRTASLPYTPALNMLSGIAIPYNNNNYGMPLTNIHYTNSANTEQTTVRGEW